MTALESVIILLLLIAFMCLFTFIHTRRKRDQYIGTYRWYVKLLK